MAKHQVAFSFSILTGILVTAGLIICINLLTYSRIPPIFERPLLVVNLMSWNVQNKIPPTPSVVTPKLIKKRIQEKTTPKEKIQALKKPVLKANVKTTVKPKPTIKPRQEIVAQEAAMPSEPRIATMKTVSVKDDTLPTPVPIFKITMSPRFLHRQEPVFPETMRAEGISGLVRLEALIDKQGRVRQVNIIQSAGRYFDAAAKHAMLRSSFYPAKIGDEPVAVLLRLPVRFGLL